MVKYIILDFGKVLAYPTTGYWQITPKFLKLVDINKIGTEKLKSCIKKHNHIISCGLNILTCEEELKCMTEFYEIVLKECSVDDYLNISKEIAYNFVYEFDKYTIYDDTKKELERLSKNYKLMLLSDNWPSVFEYMKQYDIDKYFEKIYVSSIYGKQKKDGSFFEEPINDFDIRNGEAIFIDDKEKLLKIAKEKGLEVLLMDRDNEIEDSEFKIIHSLSDIK